MASFTKVKANKIYQRKDAGGTTSARNFNLDPGVEDLKSETTATSTLTSADAGTLILVNRAAGVVFTLPSATGSGEKFKFAVQTTITSNAFKVVCPTATHKMMGICWGAADGGNTVNGWEADNNTHDYFSCNGSTTGGIVGDYWEVTDVGTGQWLVRGFISQTGTEATPFGST